jgi:hypothetical protein
MDTIQTPLHAALVKVLIAQRIRAGLRQRDVTEFDAVRRSVERSGKTAIPAATPAIQNPQSPGIRRVFGARTVDHIG